MNGNDKMVAAQLTITQKDLARKIANLIGAGPKHGATLLMAIRVAMALEGRDPTQKFTQEQVKIILDCLLDVTMQIYMNISDEVAQMMAQQMSTSSHGEVLQ